MKIGQKLALSAGLLSISIILAMVFFLNTGLNSILTAEKKARISAEIRKVRSDFADAQVLYQRFFHFIITDPDIAERANILRFTRKPEALLYQMEEQRKIAGADALDFYNSSGRLAASTRKDGYVAVLPEKFSVKNTEETGCRLYSRADGLYLSFLGKVMKNSVFLGTLVMEKQVDEKFLEQIQGADTVVAVLEKNENRLDVRVASHMPDAVAKAAQQFSGSGPDMAVMDDLYIGEKRGLVSVLPLRDTRDDETGDFYLLCFIGKQDVEKLHGRIITTALKVGAGVGLSVIIFLLFFVRFITRIFRQLNEFSSQVAQGDLTCTLDICRKDEIGGLAKTQNFMIHNLNHMVRKICDTSKMLARGSERQAVAIEETSTALAIIAATMQQNIAEAEQAGQLIHKSADMISETRRSVEESGLLSRIEDSMEDIGATGKEIRTVIHSIRRIAFQTRLISLNASIEAAHSGSKGAGFSVLADEMRKLSELSAESADKTASLVNRMTERITECHQLTGLSVTALENITESSRSITARVRNIHAASAEQADGVSQISVALSEMEQVVHQTAGAAEMLVAGLECFRISGSDGPVCISVRKNISGKARQMRRLSPPVSEGNPLAANM